MAKNQSTRAKKTRNWPLAQKLAHYSRRGRQIPGVEGRCLEWIGAKADYGHGILHVPGGKDYAHRLAWMRKHGEPPADKPHILHSCDNPPCIRLKHLRAGTHADNMRDKSIRKRCNSAGERNGRAKLTGERALAIFSAFGSQQSIADRYGIDQCTVSDIKRGKTWTHITQFRREKGREG